MVPSLFLAHGSPMLALEQSAYTDFLQELGRKIQPKAIVLFTAHWESEVLTISSTDQAYDTIYDFRGFPPELYAIKYPAKGSVALAAKLEQAFQSQGIAVRKDTTRGLDHGAWTLLYRIYPKADIPVVQISVNPFLSPKEQLEIGKALKELGQEDILIIGSGVTVHNLRLLDWESKETEPWALEFDDWIIDKVQKRDIEALNNYLAEAPYARQAVPRAEHFVPLFIAMGGGEANGTAEVIHRSYDLGALSYLCFKF